MSTILNALFVLVLLAVLLWAIVFGGIGVAVARVRGKTLLAGFGWGFFLGPIGWVVLLLARNRPGTSRFVPPDNGPPTSPETGNRLEASAPDLPDVL